MLSYVCYACRKIGKCNVVGYYFGSLLYANLNKERETTNIYRQGLLQVTAETFQWWSNELPEMLIKRNGIEHEIQIVSALVCAMQCTSQSSYLVGEATYKTGRSENKEKIMCNFCKSGLQHPLNLLVALEISLFKCSVALLLVRSCYGIT